MNELKTKLTSRKLWTAIVGIIVGLSAAFGLPENDIAQIAGIVTSAVSILSYIMAEGKIDAERIANSAPINIHIDGAELEEGEEDEEETNDGE